MSNNYYMQVDISRGVTWSIHIGKTLHGRGVYGLATMNGQVFPNVRSIKEFIKHNDDKITIVDEYGIITDNNDFVKEFLVNEPATSLEQIEYLREVAGETVHDTPYNEYGERNKYWVDSDTGTLFYNGEFF